MFVCTAWPSVPWPSIAIGDDTHRKLRVPDASILSDLSEDTEPVTVRLVDTLIPERTKLDSAYQSSSPVHASFRSQIPQEAPPHFVQLGTRDDSKADAYQWEAQRGQETPRGPKHGRYCEPGMQRAGHPWRIGHHARSVNGRDHSVGYVGGGTPLAWWGESRYGSEGTFGMDYSGLLLSRKVWLNWTHGARHQGGEGRYETDGPRILPEKP